jgi:hypothetical protein
MAAINPGTDMDPVAKLLTAIGPCLIDECLSGIGIIIGIRVLIIGIRVLLFGIRVRVIVIECTDNRNKGATAAGAPEVCGRVAA